ncbi:MAG: hypothetical protein ACJ75J_17770 [Cytophagaceae bacterium]
MNKGNFTVKDIIRETPLSEKALLQIGFKAFEVDGTPPEMKFFRKKSVFMIFLEKDKFGYLILKDRVVSNWKSQPISSIEQLETEYLKIAGEELVFHDFSEN